MSLSIRQIHPVFVGEVSGIDIAGPLSRDEVAAIEAEMDRYTVLVLHHQKITDEPWRPWDFVIWDRARDHLTSWTGRSPSPI